MILKYQTGGMTPQFTNEQLDAIISGAAQPASQQEARAAAIYDGQSGYQWNGSFISNDSEIPMLTAQEIAQGHITDDYNYGGMELEGNNLGNQNLGVAPTPTARSQAIAEARLAGQSGYTYGGQTQGFPQTSTDPTYQDAYGANLGADLSYENLDAIRGGGVASITRDEAFAASRRERMNNGGGNTFSWEGNTYHNYTADDEKRIAAERAAAPRVAKVEARSLTGSDKPLPAAPTAPRATEEFEGVMRGPEVRKSNRQARKAHRKGNRAERKENRQENRQDNKAFRKKRRSMNRDWKDKQKR